MDMSGSFGGGYGFMQNTSSNTAGESLDEAAKLLTFIDRQVIDDEDPATQGGHHVSHECDLNMIVQLKPNKFTQPDVTDFVGTLESSELMHLRILIRGDEQDPESIGSIKLELTSEEDIFFNYVCFLNEDMVNGLIQEQGLTIEYKDFLRILRKLLDDVHKHEARALLLLDNVSETAELRLQQDAEFRVDDLLVLAFSESKVDMIKAAISHRINSTQQMNMLVQERIKDIC